jgi:hypothetical protein
MPFFAVHFFFGAALTCLLLLPLIIQLERVYMGATWLVTTLGGIWACIPDLAKFIPAFEGFHDSIWANVFWLHQWLDIHVADKPGPIFVMLITSLIVIIFSTFVIARAKWYGAILKRGARIR